MSMAFADDLRRYGPDSSIRVSRDEAMLYCARLTATHYENFSVVTRLTPREHRPAFRSIYAFCRWSDDLGDEVGDAHRSLELLDWWRGELRAMYRGDARHPRDDRAGRDGRAPRHPDRAVRSADLGLRAGSVDHRIHELSTIVGLLHAIGQPSGPAGPVRRRRIRPGERRALRRHLHGAPTGQLLAGRGARPRPSGGSTCPARTGTASAIRSPTCVRCGSRRRSPS